MPICHITGHGDAWSNKASSASRYTSRALVGFDICTQEILFLTLKALQGTLCNCQAFFWHSREQKYALWQALHNIKSSALQHMAQILSTGGARFLSPDEPEDSPPPPSTAGSASFTGCSSFSILPRMLLSYKSSHSECTHASTRCAETTLIEAVRARMLSAPDFYLWRPLIV